LSKWIKHIWWTISLTIAPGAVEGLPLEAPAQDIAGQHPATPDPQALVLRRQQEDREYDQAEDGGDDQQGDEDAAPVAALRRNGHQFLSKFKKQSPFNIDFISKRGIFKL